MGADDQIARLKRDIADQKENIAHGNDPERSWVKGKMNMAEMAKIAGHYATDYANLFKENPVEALLAFTRELHELPKAQRAAAESKAGIVKVRDIKTINALAAEPEFPRSRSRSRLVNSPTQPT